MGTTKSSEDYLEAILVIRRLRGSCRNVDIAERLGRSQRHARPERHARSQRHGCHARPERLGLAAGPDGRNRADKGRGERGSLGSA